MQTGVLAISIVTFQPDGPAFVDVLRHLRTACTRLHTEIGVGSFLRILDNGGEPERIATLLTEAGLEIGVGSFLRAPGNDDEIRVRSLLREGGEEIEIGVGSHLREAGGEIGVGSLFPAPGNDDEASLHAPADTLTVSLHSTGGNLGYGRAHNLAIQDDSAEFHLILNPDVLLEPDTLVQGIKWLQAHPDVVAISPYAEDAEGQPAYLCKRYPALLDLALRGFAPRALQARFSDRLDRYKCRPLVDAGVPAEVEMISGCFMLCRGDALRAIGGFDPRYFLYFEDFALSLALRSQGRVMYLPSCRIRHFGGHAGRKGLRHVLHFLRSTLRFYNSHGWKVV